MLGWIHVIQEWREWKVRLETEWQVSSAGAQWLAEEGRDAVSKWPYHGLRVWQGDQRGSTMGVPGRGEVPGVPLIKLRRKYKAS